MSGLIDWIRRRRPRAPDVLVAAIGEAVGAPVEAWGRRSVSADVEPRELAEAGLETLDRVIGGPGDRGSAADLLSADALLTYACEAAAERGDEALDALLSELTPSRFAALLPGDPERGGAR